MADPLQVLLNQLKKRRDFKDKYPFAPVPDFSPASDSRTAPDSSSKNVAADYQLTRAHGQLPPVKKSRTYGGDIATPRGMTEAKTPPRKPGLDDLLGVVSDTRTAPFTPSAPPYQGKTDYRGESGILSGLRVLGEGLTTQFPRQAYSKLIQLAQGGSRGASVVNKDESAAFIADANKRAKQFVERKTAQYGNKRILSRLPITTTDVAQLPQNLAYSAVSGGIGAAVGAPFLLIPVAGGWVFAGVTGGVSGKIAFDLTSYEIMQQYLEMKDAESVATKGRGVTLAEENQLKAGFESEAAKYGLWEAIPEGVSNIAGAKLVLAPLTKMFGGALTKSFIPSLFGAASGEFLTETVTQKGQAGVEFRAGMRENIPDWFEAFKEIAPQTALLLATTGGAGATIVGSAQAVTFLENEIGSGHPQFAKISATIKEALADERGSIGKPTPESIAFKIAQGKALTKAEEQLRVNNPQAVETVLNQLKETSTPRFLNTPISKSKLASLVKIEALRAKSNMDSSTRTRDEWESEFIAAAKQAAYEELNEAEGLTFPASRFDDPTFSESPEMSRVRGYPPQAIQNYLRWEHLWDEGLNKFNADVYSIHSESVGNIPYTPGYLGDRSQAASKIPFWSGTLADTTGTGVPATPVTPEAATPMPSPTAQAGQAKPGMPKVSSASISKLLEDVKVIILKPGMPGYRELKVKSGGGNYDVKTNTIVIADRFENVGVHEAGHVFWGKFGTDEANKIFQAEFARFNPKVKHAILESTRKGAAGRYAKEWKEVNPKGVVTPERLEGYMGIARASITMKDVADEVKADIFKKVAQGKGHPKFPKTTALIEENLAGLVTPTEPAGVAPKPAVELPPKITVTHITNAKGGEFVIEPIKITNDEFGLFLEPDRVTFAGIAVKPSGGLWAAPGNTWEGFLKRGKLQEMLKNTTAKVTLEVDTKNVVVIDSVEDAKNKLIWKKGIRHPVVDFAALKKSGVTGVYLTQRGETQTRRHPEYPLIGWDIESLLILDEKIATIKSIEKVVEPQSPTPVLQESNPQQPEISETPKVTTTIPPVKSATEPPIEEPPVGLGVSEILPDPQNSKYWFPEPPRDIKKFVEFSKKSAPGSFSKKEGVFDTIEQANQLHLLAQYMGKNADQLAQSYISAGGNTEKAFSLLDNQIATNVLNPEGRSLAIGDILSNPAHYDLNPEQADLAKRYGFLYSEALKLAKSYGVKINELPGLDEFSQFIARRVIGKTNKVTGAVDYPPGSIGGFKLGAKIGSQKRRLFEEMTQGIELGLSYDSPENALSVYIQGIYRLIGNKQAELLVKPLTRPITKEKPVVFGESRIHQPALENRAASVAIAQAIDKVFAVQGENKILKIIAEISGALTGQVTAMDVSAPPLQGLVLLGHDIKSNMQGKPSALWAKSYADMWRIMANPQYIIRFRQNNQELYKRYVEHLGRVLHSEFVSGVPTTEKALFNIPIIGKPTSWAYKNTWGRTAASYSGFIEMGTIRLYQQLEPAWVRSQQNLYDLGSMSVRMLGATTKLGMNPNQAHAERTATIAPNYIRASLLIMKDLISRGAAAREVRDSILALIATGVLFYYAEEKLRGREPKMKPWGKRFGGDGAEAFTTEIYGQRVGLGGFLYGLIRLGADLTAMSVDDPSALVVWNNQHPLNKFLTNKRGIGVGLAVDLATGKNFFGQSFDSVDDYLWRTMESVTPISAQSQVIPSQKGKPIQGALEFTGLRVFPYSLQSQWKDEGKFLEYYDIPAKPIDQELKGTMSREQYRERHPDVDARLFITKETSSVATVAGANQAIQIANRENIDLLALPEVMRRVNTIHEREKLGLPRKTPNSPTDILVEHLLGGNNKPSMQSPRIIAPAGQKQSKELSPELKSKLGIK